MQFRIGKPCGRHTLLGLAFSACVMQVLACTLPSLVVCHKADRPPRLEFFSVFCSCHFEEVHPCPDPDEHGAPSVEASCTDIHLKSHALVTARGCRPGPSFAGQRLIPGSEPERSGAAFLNLRRVPESCALPQAASPPPLAFPASDSQLRC